MSLRGSAFILSNHVSRPYSVPSLASGAPAAPAAMGPEWLKTQEATDRSRILSLDPLYTRWQLDFLVPTDIDAVAAVNLNLSPNGYYRFFATDDGNPADHSFVTLAPTSVFNTSNATGVVANIDEAISSPDSAFIEPTDPAASWDFQVTFANPAPLPRTGTAMACIVVVAKLFGTPLLAYPRLSWILKESGADRANLSVPITVSTGTGQVFIFPFDPASLVDPSMAGIESAFSGFPGDNNSYFKADTVRCYCEDSALASRFDTGWLPRSLAATASDYDGTQPVIKEHYFLPETVTLGDPSTGRITLMVLDDQADHDPVDAAYWGFANAAGLITLRREPDGYVEAGVAVAGPALFLSSGIPYGSAGVQAPVVVQGLGGASLIGQAYGADTFRLRTISVELQVTREELDILKDRIAFRRGNSGAFYFAAEPDIPASRQVFNSGWWTLKSMSGESQLPMAYDYDASGQPSASGPLLYRIVLELEEKL